MTTCSGCNNEKAKSVALVFSISYLCPNPDCNFYDADYAFKIVSQVETNETEIAAWDYRLADGTYMLTDIA